MWFCDKYLFGAPTEAVSKKMRIGRKVGRKEEGNVKNGEWTDGIFWICRDVTLSLC
ncbi:MAG: hypothetical protein G01um101416_946 [Microgenomates group bacterium Gr01-1014_16]|nr:MAG: hypothetical protein G01um101416_946 [Microgenomates group bacterium Gr01-1014_16]